MTNAAFKTGAGSIVTPAGRLMYPMLFTAGPLAKGETDEKKFGWQTNLLLAADADLKVLADAVEAVIAENMTAAQRAKSKIAMPFLKTADQAKLAHLADDFPILLRMKSRAYRKTGQKNPAPQIIGPAKDPIKEENEADEIYSGREARVSLSPFWYTPQSGSAGYGISLGLGNVQVLRHFEALAGGNVKASAEFEAVASDALADLDIPF
jgi:hypothetical protein